MIPSASNGAAHVATFTPVERGSDEIKRLRPSAAMRKKFLFEVASIGLPRGVGEHAIVTAADLEMLPAAAQRYMRFMRVLGRPRDFSFCARWDGRFRMAPDKPWMPCEAWQFNSAVEVARIFHMRLRFGGILPTYVRDLYVHGGGHMAGKVLDTFSIVDDQSEKITIGELVTWVNDALWFAPSMLLDARTTWTGVDDLTFDVSTVDRGTTVKARVFVDERGAMTDFSTTDRFGEEPANRNAGMVRAEWTTPVDGWDVRGIRPRPLGGRAIWHFPTGDFCYAETSTAHMQIAFNVPPGEAPQT
jgi:hypothetical protein